MRSLGVVLMLALVACAETPTKKSGPRSSPADDKDTSASTEPETDTSETEPPPEPTPSTPSPSTPSGTSTKMRWNKLDGFVYSLDVKTPEGEWIGPCLDVSLIGSATSVTYDGVCKSARDRAVPNPAGYRLYFTNDIPKAYWADFVEVAPSNSGEVVFELPTTAPSAVDLSWNQKSPTAEYSLDVFLRNGEKIRPCVDVTTIGKSTSYTFTGTCSGASTRSVDMREISDFVVCWAENGDWAHAGCSGLPYTGLGRSRAIQN